MFLRGLGVSEYNFGFVRVFLGWLCVIWDMFFWGVFLCSLGVCCVVWGYFFEGCFGGVRLRFRVFGVCVDWGCQGTLLGCFCAFWGC